ncbi:MAG: hypothetical protein WCN92_02685 [Eubacteriales bacterium]
MKRKTGETYTERFLFGGKENILLEKDFGIVNDRISAGINYSEVACVSGIWSPPYVSSDFLLEMRLFGEKVKTSEYEWYPYAVTIKGEVRGVNITSSTVLVPGQRAIVTEIKLENRTNEAVTMPVKISINGGLDIVEKWDFQRPVGEVETDSSVDKNILIKKTKDCCLITGTDLVELTWFAPDAYCSTGIILAADGNKKFHIIVVLGDRKNTPEDYEKIACDPQKAIRQARKDFEYRAEDLFQKLPEFDASDKRLVSFYNRSLVHYLTNRWRVPEFALNPYYSTGSIKGGCLLSYLWDFSEGWELHPLFDPTALKEHMKQYLKIDITSCFSFDPILGDAVGPWYPVNQEKIIGLIYYYILLTGDAAFLNENVNGKTVLDWAVYHAAFWDKESSEAELYDYGLEGEHHLELRRGYPYNGVMPDLNARRYQGYMWAYELAGIAGRKAQYLCERAEKLKALVKEGLWDSQGKWFDFISEGKRDKRYTVQMFKLIGSGILDTEELNGLLSHLTEDEFLSRFGLNSLSKKDQAYDPADIDNGGPGSCSVFPPQIVERLYKAGLPEYAEDILKRILWWGERVPYWGDSFVADHIDYRSDTPLQCTIGGVVGAQMIIFGMFGVSVMQDGNIIFKPNPPSFSRDISLKGLKIKGKAFDITVTGKTFTLSTGNIAQSFNVGEEGFYIFKSGSFVCRENNNVPDDIQEKNDD